MKKLKKLSSLILAFMMLIVTVVPSFSKVNAADGTIVVSKYAKTVGDWSCSADTKSATFKGEFKMEIPTIEILSKYENEFKTASEGFFGNIPYPHGKDGKNKIAYIDYTVDFPVGVTLGNVDKTAITSTSKMFNGNHEVIKTENKVRFKIRLIDQNWKGVYDAYLNDKANATNSFITITIPYEVSAKSFEEVEKAKTLKATASGDFSSHSFGFNKEYITDNLSKTLIEKDSNCFENQAEEKVTLTFKTDENLQFKNGQEQITKEVKKGTQFSADLYPTSEIEPKTDKFKFDNIWLLDDGREFAPGNPIEDNFTFVAHATPKQAGDTPNSTQEVKMNKDLEVDLLVNEDTTHDAVYETSKDSELKFTGKLFVNAIKTQMNEIEKTYGQGKKLEEIKLEDFGSTFIAVLKLPKEISSESDLTYELEGANGVFEIKNKVFDKGNDANKVIVYLVFTPQVKTYKDLKDKIDSVQDELKVNVKGLSFTKDANQGKEYTVIGEINGKLEAKATNLPAGKSVKFILDWNGKQNADGKDIKATDDNSIQLTAKLKNQTEIPEVKQELPLGGDILVGTETENTKVYEVEKKDSVEFSGTLDVQPIKDRLVMLETQYQKIEPNFEKISVENLDFSMVATFELPEEMTFEPEQVTAKLENANDKLEIVETKVEGKRVKVTLRLKGQDTVVNYDNYKKLSEAVRGTGDLLKVTLSGAKFNEKAKAETNYTVKGTVGGNFKAKATSNNKTIPFNFTFKGEQVESGKDFIIKDDVNNKSIQFTLKFKKVDVPVPNPEPNPQPNPNPQPSPSPDPEPNPNPDVEEEIPSTPLVPSIKPSVKPRKVKEKQKLPKTSVAGIGSEMLLLSGAVALMLSKKRKNK